MRTSLAYAISVGLHGAVFGALAYAATAYPEFLTIRFAVREGDANGAVSQPRWVRRIEATFDNQIAQPLATVVMSEPAPVMSPRQPKSLLPTPESSVTLATPFDPATAANLDHAPITQNPAIKTTSRRIGRGPGPLAELTPTVSSLQPRSEAVAMTVSPTITETQLESTASALTEIPEVIPERVAAPVTTTAQPGLAASAAAVTVQPLEPGNDDFDAIAANSPQGARVSQLPSRLPRNREPTYPEELRRDGIGGTVLLRVTIAADGKAEEVTLAKSSGYSAFDESALTAVRTWRFEPARRNNVAVKYTVKLPITFSVKR